MANDTERMCYVLQKGAVQEEAWAWADVEAACRAGRLSPDTMIFVPETNQWREARDTELARLFAREVGEGPVPEAPDLDDAYATALARLDEAPGDTEAILHAAELAAGLGNGSAARKHYQEALDAHPYHPRIVRQVKRRFPADAWKTMRFVEKVDSAWSDVAALFAYPLARGPLYLLIPAVVLSLLGGLPVVGFAVPIILALWLSASVRVSARLDRVPPLWHELVAHPAGEIARPLVLVAVAGAEFFVPLLVCGQVAVSASLTLQPSAIAFVRESPFVLVLLVTIALAYLPAVFILSATPAASPRCVLNPAAVGRHIVRMEQEYIGAVAFVVASFLVWTAVRAQLGGFRFVGEAVAMLVAVYSLMVAGRVLGRLKARFREEATPASGRSRTHASSSSDIENIDSR